LTSKKEASAVKEASRLGIPVIALVDTNTDPDGVTFIVPSNDDSPKAINFIIEYLAQCAKDGVTKHKENAKKVAQEREAAAKEKVAALKALKEAPKAEAKPAVAEAKPEAKKPAPVAAKAPEKVEEKKAQPKKVAAPEKAAASEKAEEKKTDEK